jgi:hypothetical protein
MDGNLIGLLKFQQNIVCKRLIHSSQARMFFIFPFKWGHVFSHWHCNRLWSDCTLGCSQLAYQKKVQIVHKKYKKVLTTFITKDWKQVLRNYLVANLQYYSIKRPKSGNLENQKKKVEKNTYKIIGSHKYKLYNFKGFLGIKSIKDTL